MTELLTEHTLFDMLHQGECELVFKKVDGELRTMRCTLDAKILSEQVPTKTYATLEESKEAEERSKNYKRAPGVLVIWDLEKKSFRSCKVDNVISCRKI